jgi:hypothetical protein
MHSQPVSGDAGRRRAERKFKSIQKAKAQASQADHPFRQTEAEKTVRLRGLRLAKEATDRDTANHDAAAATASRTERARAFQDLRPQIRRNQPDRRVRALMMKHEAARLYGPGHSAQEDSTFSARSGWCLIGMNGLPSAAPCRFYAA